MCGSESDRTTPYFCFKAVVEQLGVRPRRSVNNPARLSVVSKASGRAKLNSNDPISQTESRSSAAVSMHKSVRNGSTMEVERKVGNQSGYSLFDYASLVEEDDSALRTVQNNIKFQEYFLSQLSKAAVDNPILITCTDVQWAEVYSWELLEKIIKTSDNIYIAIFSRPFREYCDIRCIPIAERIKAFNLTTSIKVNNLAEDEFMRMAKSTVGADIVVKENIVSDILKHSGGSHIFAEMLMKSALREKCLVVKSGVLVPDDNVDFEPKFPKHFHSRIAAQFDKLNQNFQFFLRVAAVLGLSFSIGDAIRFGAIEGDPDNYTDNIAHWDIYGYLIKDTKDRTKYTFKSVLVHKCIYDMILVTHKMEIHHKVAIHMEETLKYNRTLVALFTVYWHYNHTENVSKKIDYLEKLARHTAEAHDYTQSTIYYKKLQKYCLSKEAQNEFSHIKGNYRDVIWIRELGDVLAVSARQEEAIQKYSEALGFLDVEVIIGSTLLTFLRKLCKSFMCGRKSTDITNPVFYTERSLVLKSLALSLLAVDRKVDLINIIKYSLTIKNPDIRLVCAVSYAAQLSGFSELAKRSAGLSDEALKHSGSLATTAVDERGVTSGVSQIECLEYMCMVRFATMSQAAFKEHSSKLLNLTSEASTATKFRDIMLLSTAAFLHFGNLEQICSLASQFSHFNAGLEDEEYKGWQSLIEIQYLIPKGKLSDATEMVSQLQKSLRVVDTSLKSVQMQLIESLAFELECYKNSKNPSITDILHTAGSALKLSRTNDPLLVMPLFHYMRGLLCFIASGEVISGGLATVIIEYAIEAKKVLQSLKAFRISHTLLELHNYITFKLQSNMVKAMESLSNGYSPSNGDDAMRYLNGLILSVFASISEENRKLAKNVSITNPFQHALDLFNAMGAMHEVKLLNRIPHTLRRRRSRGKSMIASSSKTKSVVAPTTKRRGSTRDGL
jgi:hypothetical protein